MKPTFLDAWGWPIASLAMMALLMPTHQGQCVGPKQVLYYGAVLTLIGIFRAIMRLARS